LRVVAKFGRTVTAIGRGIQSASKEKSCIKRADRLLSNEAFQADIPLIYAALTKVLVQTKQPLILVDWSNADSKNVTLSCGPAWRSKAAL
jgi:hypothetical protein